MADDKHTPAWVLITVALIGACGVIIAAMIAESNPKSDKTVVVVLTAVVSQPTSQVGFLASPTASLALNTPISKIIVLANDPTGVSTGLKVQQGDMLTFSASGTWCWGGTTDCSSPDGTQGRPSGPEECCAVIQNEYFGKLIGRVGNWTFPIGSQATVTMKQGGDLLLLMNDRIGAYADNTGSITVEIETQSR
jgi:PA-IL-like protein